MMSATMHRLKAPPGADEANSETTRYHVDARGFVDVPQDMVEPLTRVGGFAYVGPTPPAPIIVERPAPEFVERVAAALAKIGVSVHPPTPEFVALVIAGIEVATEQPAPTPSPAPSMGGLVIPT
jgi:hypothetical protein